MKCHSVKMLGLALNILMVLELVKFLVCPTQLGVLIYPTKRHNPIRMWTWDFMEKTMVLYPLALTCWCIIGVLVTGTRYQQTVQRQKITIIRLYQVTALAHTFLQHIIGYTTR